MRDQHVLCTGGSGALGSKVTTALVRRGARVTVPVYQTAEGDRLRTDLGPLANLVVFAQADLRDEAAVAALVDGMPKLGALVHLVGGFAMGATAEFPLEKFRERDKGPYGGAVNGDGDLVVTGKSDDEPTIRIDAQSLDIDYLDVVGDSFEGGKYGMALDQDGNLWAASHHDDQGVHVYDFGDEEWTTIDGTGGTELKGIQVDRNGSARAAGVDPSRLVRLDVASRSVIDDHIDLPGCSSPIGVSIDVDGFVWVVDHGANKAFKVDPNDYSTEQVGGLAGPYSYSDMTGSGLGLVVNPPG
jgi:hypothetical protein